MKRSLVATLLVASSWATVALAQQTTPPRTGDMKAAMSGNADATSSNTDRAFAAVAISHARLSREVSELVGQKATNPEIKKLAQDIAKEQQQLSQKVQAAAQKNGMTLQPDLLLPRDQAVLDFLKELPPTALERTYVFHLAGATQTHMLMAQWAAKNTQKPEIRQVAEEIATKLQQRDQAIQQLAKTEVNTAGRTAGDSP